MSEIKGEATIFQGVEQRDQSGKRKQSSKGERKAKRLQTVGSCE